jgi:predicted SAM-dependent methyltransferase
MLGLYADANTHWWAAYRINDSAQIRYLMNRYFLDQNHPERLALYPLCRGKGIDVGCGSRKTHPNAIGVDIRANGEAGTVGCEAGKLSQADISASGDDLAMFRDAELDYVVQRHNLEHYQDPVKTLDEWKRVLKPGGVLGMVVPDDGTVDTIRLDTTHRHVYTQESLSRLLRLIGGFEIIHLGELLHSWSFVCIAQRLQDNGGQEEVQRFDYRRRLNQLRVDLLKIKASEYQKNNDHQLAEQCLKVVGFFSNPQR